MWDLGLVVLKFIGKQTDKQTSKVYIVVFRIVLNMNEQSLEFKWMPEISTSRAVAEDTSLLHTKAPGPVLYTAHRQHTEGIFPDELAVGEDEQGSCYCVEPRIH